MSTVRRGIERYFGQDGALFFDLASKAFVLHRISSSKAAPEDGDCASTGCERASMRSRVGAPSQSADDRKTCPCQVAGQPFRKQTSASGRPPGANHSHRQFVSIAQRA
jgi:hypothetical protein